MSAHDAACDQAEQEVLAREREWLDALCRRDEQSLRSILADEFTLVSWASGGEKLTKDDYLADMRDLDLVSCGTRDCCIDVYDNAAVVRCRLEWEARVSNRMWSAAFLITDVWIRRNGVWHAVARHSSIPCVGDETGTDGRGDDSVAADSDL